MLRWGMLASGCVAMLLAVCQPASASARIKDITELEGARPNQLFGFGLVVGLAGTGGRSLFTQQVTIDMLTRFGNVPRNAAQERDNFYRGDAIYRSGNVSAVMVTAELGPFTRRGSRLDVVVSVLDDATSLLGGTLILTPLRGADGVDYCVAQGPLSLGGAFLFQNPPGSHVPLASVQKNHPNVGRIPGGGIVEREARGEIICNGQLHLLLKEPDYDSARAIARIINQRYPGSSLTLDAGTVNVTVPRGVGPQLVAFVSDIGLMEIGPDVPARVVINERTGTIVAGDQVKISSIAVAHGNLSIVTNLNLLYGGAGGFGAGLGGFGGLGGLGGGGVGAYGFGYAPYFPPASVQTTEEDGPVHVLPRTITVAGLAQALNALGDTPRDLITILQAIKRSGALHAELVVM